MTKYPRHIEWIVLFSGLFLLAVMDPYSKGVTFCLLDHMGIYCPGEGLGHSIAFLFRGELTESINANLMGPVAVVILAARITTIWTDLYKEHKNRLNGVINV